MQWEYQAMLIPNRQKLYMLTFVLSRNANHCMAVGKCSRHLLYTTHYLKGIKKNWCHLLYMNRNRYPKNAIQCGNLNPIQKLDEPIGLVMYVIFYTYLVFDLFGYLRLLVM